MSAAQLVSLGKKALRLPHFPESSSAGKGNRFTACSAASAGGLHGGKSQTEHCVIRASFWKSFSKLGIKEHKVKTKVGKASRICFFLSSVLYACPQADGFRADNQITTGRWACGSYAIRWGLPLLEIANYLSES
jgi:hypothetical protein